MKIIKKTTAFIIAVIAVVIIILFLTNTTYLIKAVKTIYLNGHTTAFLDDYKYFSTRKIDTSQAQPWPLAVDYNTIEETETLKKTHKELNTIAYLIIKNDSIWHESYFDGYNEKSLTNSFSMAKSITSAALGKAIEEGYIKNLNQKVIDFLPQLTGPYASELTVGDLSGMSSGLEWDEHYSSPTSVTTKAYFYNDLREMMLEIPIENKPNQRFEYQSGDTQLLAMVIEKATNQNLSDYVSNKFWKPMGAENIALWQIDDEKNGIEKAYCCFTSNARDFARFGKLYKNNGNWNGKQLLDSTFIKTSTTPKFKNQPEYGHGWWLHHYLNKPMFYMRGHLGQFVIVIPKENVIIVRLGHKKGKQTDTDPHSNDFYIYVNEALEMLKQRK